MSKILLIEDDDRVRFALARVLEGAGYEVVDAGNGNEGMALLDASTDLVITDILMPETEGIEVILELKFKRLNAPPVIAISGGGKISGEHYLETAKEFGADAILKKPFDNDELLAAVSELIQRPPMAPPMSPRVQ